MVLAVPPRPAASLLPGLKTPSKFRAIVNAHFRFDPPVGQPPILGVIGGLVEWLFAFPERLSVTLSQAAWTGPVSNDAVSIGFTQHINANDALRTGSYAKTLTYTQPAILLPDTDLLELFCENEKDVRHFK